MKTELRHYAYAPTKGGRSIPADRLINELGDMADNYIGTFSEYNPIIDTERLVVYIRKNTEGGFKKPFSKENIKIKSGINLVNVHLSWELSKASLLALANAMDDGDTLQIATLDLDAGNEIPCYGSIFS